MSLVKYIYNVLRIKRVPRRETFILFRDKFVLRTWLVFSLHISPPSPPTLYDIIFCEGGLGQFALAFICSANTEFVARPRDDMYGRDKL